MPSEEFIEEPLGGIPRPLHGIQPKKVNTIAELIEFLKQFPPHLPVAVNDNFGIPREDVFIEETSISSVLTSTGDEIIW